jgi:hypothetical protein
VLGELRRFALCRNESVVAKQLAPDKNYRTVDKCCVLAQSSKDTIEPIEGNDSSTACPHSFDASVACREIWIVKAKPDSARIAKLNIVPGEVVNGAVAAVSIDRNQYGPWRLGRHRDPNRFWRRSSRLRCLRRRCVSGRCLSGRKRRRYCWLRNRSLRQNRSRSSDNQGLATALAE